MLSVLVGNPGGRVSPLPDLYMIFRNQGFGVKLYYHEAWTDRRLLNPSLHPEATKKQEHRVLSQLGFSGTGSYESESLET